MNLFMLLITICQQSVHIVSVIVVKKGLHILIIIALIVDEEA